jgi:hypothetical protein
MDNSFAMYFTYIMWLAVIIMMASLIRVRQAKVKVIGK